MPTSTGTSAARLRQSGTIGDQHSVGSPLIGIVDGNRAHAERLSRILASQGRDVQCYESAEPFLQAVGAASVGCVITELVMPDMSGRALQERLQVAAPALSVVVVTGYADVRSTVELMKLGAVTVLEKPARAASVISAVVRATQQSLNTYARICRTQEIQRRLATLTEEERRIANEMIAGTPIKTLALEFQISMRTVDRRRQSLLSKMNANSVGELASLFAETSMRADAEYTIRHDRPATTTPPDAHHQRNGHHRPARRMEETSFPSSVLRKGR